GVAIAALVGTVLWWMAARAARNEEGDDPARAGAAPLSASSVMGVGWRSADEPLAPVHGVGAGQDVPLQVLHVVARSQLRGAERVAMELGTELDELGHDNRVVAVGLAHDGGRIEGIDPLVERSDVGVGVLLRAARQLRAELRAEPVDVIL
ncbi:MAG: hypothetical protein KDB04_13220, partial [Acidimicrobiales bacterium]|nr:hypothetical protein [Acidimicrobiales bacterium]